MKYITTPIEEFKGLGLNPAEKMILSIYKYYTEQGKCKCCNMTNDEIADELELGLRTVTRTKKKFKEMNLIRTDGGIKVYYLGVRGVKLTLEDGQNDTLEGQIDTLEGQNDTLEGQIDTLEGQIDTHNKEIKKNKNNKENKGGKTNFDLILQELPDAYKTPDKIEYVKETGYYDKINNLSPDDIVLSFVVSNVKSLIDKKYPITYNPIIRNISDIKKEEDSKDFDFTTLL